AVERRKVRNQERRETDGERDVAGYAERVERLRDRQHARHQPWHEEYPRGDQAPYPLRERRSHEASLRARFCRVAQPPPMRTGASENELPPSDRARQRHPTSAS